MSAVSDLDRWLRTEFVEINTVLDNAYFAARVAIQHDVHELDQLTRTLRDDGGVLVSRIHELPAAGRYQLLGAVGMYLASCRRHEVDAPDAAQTVAGRLGLALGVAPRFVFAHASTHNPAVDGVFRTFTSLPDEHTFVTYNALAVLAYRRAAVALTRIPAMGVTSSFATAQFDVAEAALGDVLRANQTLAAELDRERFSLNVRPYFMPYRVCGVEYRGVNAGDFADVGEIDVALGLCDPSDPFYLRILTEKYPYVPPEDQPRLRDLPPDLLTLFETDTARNVDRFLAVCRAHGAAYAFHHHRLVLPFLASKTGSGIDTASGPPLDVVVAGLARLVDLRAARDRPGTARGRLARLRAATAGSAPR
jgi:hypothetical protein